MNLDAYQQAAVLTTEPRVLVVATPGSGKTRTLAARFLHMRNDRNVPTQEIALLTFTRFAANEMVARIGTKNAGAAFIGTFHSFALRIIEHWGTVTSWEPQYLTILDEEESRLEEREVLTDLGIINASGQWYRFTQRDWEKFKADLRDNENLPIDGRNLPMFEALRAFKGRLQALNTLTYDSIISEARILIRHPVYGAEIRNRYRHILVDEAQDTDSQQWGLLRDLQPQTTYLVGDLDQSIYGWRGARNDLFKEYAQGSSVYQLPNSYRFGFNIGDAASKLIRHNEDRIDIAIQAIAGNQGHVETIHNAAYGDVGAMVREELKTRQPQDVAILARKWDTLENIADNLKSMGLPFTICGGKDDITKTAEFRVVRGYLRLSVNPQDRRAFMAIAAAEHFSTDRIWDIRKKAAVDGISLMQASGVEIPPTFQEIARMVPAKDPAGQYDRALSYLHDMSYREAIVDNRELVRTLALQSIQDRMSETGDTVTLSTVHGAKGLEWPTVYLVGLNSKTFPSPRSIREGRMGEERRLAYVAMTRAEEKLVLVHQADTGDQPSQFIWESGIPETKKIEDDLRM